jgi:hypothetical protein
MAECLAYTDGTYIRRTVHAQEKMPTILAAPGTGKSRWAAAHPEWVDADIDVGWHPTRHTEAEEIAHYKLIDRKHEDDSAAGLHIVGSLFRDFVPDAIVLINPTVHQRQVAERPNLKWAQAAAVVERLKELARTGVPHFATFDDAARYLDDAARHLKASLVLVAPPGRVQEHVAGLTAQGVAEFVAASLPDAQDFPSHTWQVAELTIDGTRWSLYFQAFKYGYHVYMEPPNGLPVHFNGPLPVKQQQQQDKQWSKRVHSASKMVQRVNSRFNFDVKSVNSGYVDDVIA